MRQNPKPFEIYKHFKGNSYQILSIAEHSETGEQLVIYQALYGEFKIYARELSVFMSPVDRTKYPNATQANRFELQVGISSNMEPLAKTMESPNKEVSSNIETPSKTEVQHDVKEAEENKITALDNADQETDGLDPMLIQFLDADSYEEKLNILTGVRHRITKEMLTTMAVASDIEIKDGSIEEQFDSLKQCLMTLQKYECNRLR